MYQYLLLASIVVSRCLEVLILEQMRRYEEKMKEIQQLEHAEALAIKELKLRRQNTVRNKMVKFFSYNPEGVVMSL